ncbi:MAG TPA: glucoamylase family protein [Gemmatimonadaceae bacterium]|nr:glucoamylase family protein [Gemmatimonadaceae bacterium]
MATRARVWRDTPLLARLNATGAILAGVHDRLAEAAKRDVDTGPAGEWLLDNYHVVQEHIREVRESLPRGFYRELPELAAGPLAGYPRVYELAITLISHTEGRVDLDNVDLFTGAFQEISPLSIGELWAMPAMLRLGLIENVRRMTLRTQTYLEEVEDADRWARRIQAANEAGTAELGAALNDFVTTPRPLTPMFVSRFLHRLRQSAGPFPPLVWLEQWIADEGLSAEDAAARSTQRLALTQIMMANSITSLRAVAYMDWRSFVETQSAMEAVLREDPSGFYERMRFATRDEYRHVVERIAKRTHRQEEEIAQLAVDLARGAGDAPGSSLPGSADRTAADDVRSHIGYFLIDHGRLELERAAGYRPAFSERIHRWVLRHPNIVFVGGLLTVTIAALVAMLFLGGPAALPDLLGGRAGLTAWLVVLLVSVILATEIAVSVVNQLVTAFLPPRTLPKLDFGERRGVPEECRTAVVIPTLFGSVDAVREALENLEAQFLANREAHLHFALLSDFTDSPTETRPNDEAIVQAAADGVRALNFRYATSDEQPFYLFHRPRKWNSQQGTWMGWERKRGKLAEFNRFVRGRAAADAFLVVVGDVPAIRRVRYVITLDSDTVLPPDTAPLLIGALAHPLNRAAYNPDAGRVVRGYGILQPRVSVSLPSAHRSRFAAIHSGHPGVDPYTTAVSDVYQDLYGEGSFTGKGIYDVDAFEQATHGRFPENTLLSHDLIEGNYARAGLATDITVYDDYPSRYLTYARRKHRWIRGDWQLLGWLGTRVPGPQGTEPNRLSLLSRWKILDNLRRSTVEMAQLIFLIAGWTVLPGSPLRWTAIGLAVIATPWLVSLALAVLRPPLDKSWRAYYAAVGRDAVMSAQQWALAVTFLPHQAWVSADAIVRTLWRLFVTRRNLLEWQSASQTERAVTRNARAVWRTMWPAVALSVLLPVVMAAILLRGGSPLGVVGAMFPLIALWLASPAIAHELSEPWVRRELGLPATARADAIRYAQCHWRFFERHVNAATHWLAPDNFQELPTPVVAMRTSPTNIGLQLLATLSAFDLGFVGLEETMRRLEAAFRSLERMRRFRGHFFNWYDLHDLQVLEPAYISTVDSGNLAGHLLSLRQACLGIGEVLADRTGGAGKRATPAVHAAALELGVGSPAALEMAQRLEALAARASDYAIAMDFRFLFDEGRKLFVIGYQHATHTFDDSYYDLLASEARLASFIAIAKNEVPVEHWFRLGRTLTYAAGEPALVSWSGSMFEYLMPALVMESFPDTVLDQSYHGAVRRQIAYGAERHVPWGVSESAYNVRDRHFTYQYRAFGVPDLGLKRGLGRDLVIAPYASALAALIDPGRALANLATLEKMGVLGEYGFRDAVDYTRPNPGERYAIVYTYMAHHIGMGLVALANVLVPGLWPRRFHSDPLVRAAELFLHERIPRRLVPQEPQVARADEALPDPELERPAVREIDATDTPIPHVALLGHLPYTIMVTHCGGGYSRYEQLAVTRWRADATRDHTGQFCYVKDVTGGRMWSAAHQPVCAPADWYRALLASDRVTFHRSDGEIETRTEIAVVPEDSAEVRRVTLTNNGDDTREIELTSYGEIVLALPEADRVHPAFANLFVETEWHEWCTAITADRRPRSSEEQRLWCAHVVDSGDDRSGPVTYETDRARFLGRGRTPRDPLALDLDGPLSGTTGAVLDPIVALRTRVRLAPGQSASVAFTTLVATSRQRLFELAGRYHDPHTAQRALDLAWTSTQVELRELGISPIDAAVYQELAGNLFYGGSALRVPSAELRRSRGSQPLLWANGISGDWPILLASIESVEGLPTLRQLFAAHHYWRRRGMTVDLVIINAHPSTYLQDLHDRIMESILASNDAGFTDRPGGVFLRRRDLLGPNELLMLRATARAIIPCDGRSLARIVDAARQPEERELEDRDEAPPLRPSGRSTPPSALAVRRLRARRDMTSAASSIIVPRWSSPPSVTAGDGSRPPEIEPLLFDNGFGGVTDDADYRVRVSGGRLPPAPWANVVANALGGFVVTERGSGFTWVENSYFFRLTPWHNDPVSDPPGDVLYVRDDESREVWSATPCGVVRDAVCTVHHRPGSSTFELEHAGIASHLTLAMADAEAARISLLRLTNRSARTRRLSVTAFVEWSLGVLREHTQHLVRTHFDRQQRAIFAQNHFNPEFTDWTAFCALSEKVTSHTGDRREFLGRNGTVADPAALRGGRLEERTGAGMDPCAALQCELTLAPGETREVVVVLGAANDEGRAREIIAALCRPDRARDAIAASVAEWDRRLSVVTVRTPEPSFDLMVNRWALYQALACRMWARSAVYQSSGAYGFRDQLQDVMAFVYAEPVVAREHILRAASRQFVEGDVQHWWHPHTGRGVRTRFSDDLVWLPFVADHYVRVTGDARLLDEVVPFLAMRALEPGEHEVYDLPQVADERASVYEHCLRALRKACTHGPHGLPLIGGGDWNDGMNRVGSEGRGESVWLAWFLITTLRAFAEQAAGRGDRLVANDLLERATVYASAVEAEGWDGEWYRRAYFDDGTPLGSAVSDECRIDSIAQSWSVISGAGAEGRQEQAMRSVERYLVDNDARILLLLTPPFDKTPLDPGYIKGYLPGVRENGAQYTHAALWTVLATALRGDNDRAFQLYQMLNPLMHARTPDEAAIYKVEPYVVAADVYSAAGHLGRGGWTWYTGSASWMYRVGLENILGFRKRGETLEVRPCVPSDWPGYEMVYRYRRTAYTITIENPHAASDGGLEMTLDGRLLDTPTLPLTDDGEEHVVVVRPSARAHTLR